MVSGEVNVSNVFLESAVAIVMGETLGKVRVLFEENVDSGNKSSGGKEKNPRPHGDTR